MYTSRLGVKNIPKNEIIATGGRNLPKTNQRINVNIAHRHQSYNKDLGIILYPFKNWILSLLSGLSNPEQQLFAVRVIVYNRSNNAFQNFCSMYLVRGIHHLPMQSHYIPSTIPELCHRSHWKLYDNFKKLNFWKYSVLCYHFGKWPAVHSAIKEIPRETKPSAI